VSEPQPNYKQVARETLGLKREVDEALGAFAERLLANVPPEHQPSMQLMDAMVDEAGEEMIKPTARYVKRQLRRLNVSTDKLGGLKPQEADY